MELEFKKVGSRYEAEFEATDNFNLHIEREAKGDVQIFQKANAECDYATDPSWEEEFASKNIDKDFSMLVFPKYIKIVSESEVTRCIATISGGGSSESVVDNPDDYEKRYTLIATDASGAVKQHTAEELHLNAGLFTGFDPVKLEIVCEYLKDDVPYRFIPETYRVTLKFGDVDSSGYPYFDYELVDNVITINVKYIDWYVADFQFTFYANGEQIIQTFLKAT